MRICTETDRGLGLYGDGHSSDSDGADDDDDIRR